MIDEFPFAAFLQTSNPLPQVFPGLLTAADFPMGSRFDANLAIAGGAVHVGAQPGQGHHHRVLHRVEGRWGSSTAGMPAP